MSGPRTIEQTPREQLDDDLVRMDPSRLETLRLTEPSRGIEGISPANAISFARSVLRHVEEVVGPQAGRTFDSPDELLEAAWHYAEYVSLEDRGDYVDPLYIRDPETSEVRQITTRELAAAADALFLVAADRGIPLMLNTGDQSSIRDAVPRRQRPG